MPDYVDLFIPSPPPGHDGGVLFRPARLKEGIAVCTLWAPVTRKTAAEYANAAIIGPCRSLAGVRRLIGNLLAYPEINDLRLVGYELPAKGPHPVIDALRYLWWSGIIPDCLGDIDPADLSKLLSAVTLHSQVEGHRFTCNRAETSRGVCHYLLPKQPERTSYPHGDPGERIAANTLDDLWPKALKLVTTFGVDTYGNSTLDYQNLVSVVRDPTATVDQIRDGKTKHLEVTWQGVETYFEEITEAPEVVPEGGYTYGNRFRGMPDCSNPGPDQIGWMQQQLDVQPRYRGIFATTWNPIVDYKLKSRPCLVSVQFRQQNNQLHLTAYFRSHDIYGAYPTNLAGLCLWLVMEAEARGIPVGPLTVMSSSAHVYAHNWQDARARSVFAGRKLDLDPRSSWDVHGGPGGWIATAYGKDTQALATFNATDANLLRRQIERSGLVTSIGSALWIGQQIGKRERE